MCDRECEDDERDEAEDVRGYTLGLALATLSGVGLGWLGRESLLTSMPVMSFIPTPKNRESFAARSRRMRNIGSEGLSSDALAGLGDPVSSGDIGASWECAVGGDVGADMDPEDAPQWDRFEKGGGLGGRNALRIGDVSGA